MISQLFHGYLWNNQTSDFDVVDDILNCCPCGLGKTVKKSFHLP